MNKKMLTSSGIVLALTLFFSVNVLSNMVLKSARLDLTEHSLFTLSDGTRNILRTLDEPITLRLYLSKKLATSLPGINSYATRVEELLEEFEQAAGGNLTLFVIDPEPFSEEEDRAVGYGLQGVPVTNGNTLFYFGLAGSSSTDKEETIPFFQPDREEFLEYDLAKLVYQLAHPKQKTVGLISSLPLDGGPTNPLMPGGGGGQPVMIMDQIRQLFEVQTLQTDITDIPESVDVLMIVHPKHFSDPTLYAIDQFVLKGGRALVFVDPHAESDRGTPNPMNPMAAMQAPKNSDLSKLFTAWGVELTSGKVVGDLPLARKVNFRNQSRMQVIDYPVWIDLPPSHLNQEDIVTGQLPNLTMATAGILQKTKESTTELIPLIESDTAAMQIDVARLQFLTDANSLLRSYHPEDERFTMAARLTGSVKTAFPNGQPSSKKDDDPNALVSKDENLNTNTHVTESHEPINVIVVADTDLLQDRFWVQVQSFLGQRIGFPTAGNGSFVTNALDNLTGSNDLISVRNRGSFSRPFTHVRAIQQEAEQRFRQKEQRLQERVKTTERKLQELQQKDPEGGALILTQEQQEEIALFRENLLQTRKELRAVQHELQKDIESLEGIIKFMNIGLVPLIITGSGLAFSAYRIRRRNPSR
ncbi:MAG: hypothetical protein GKS05_11090 [Nitrospirales bacterium]|nr:hypothetical protein [Nitrospirales bacterium]